VTGVTRSWGAQLRHVIKRDTGVTSKSELRAELRHVVKKVLGGSCVPVVVEEGIRDNWF